MGGLAAGAGLSALGSEASGKCERKQMTDPKSGPQRIAGKHTSPSCRGLKLTSKPMRVVAQT